MSSSLEVPEQNCAAAKVGARPACSSVWVRVSGVPFGRHALISLQLQRSRQRPLPRSMTIVPHVGSSLRAPKSTSPLDPGASGVAGSPRVSHAPSLVVHRLKLGLRCHGGLDLYPSILQKEPLQLQREEAWVAPSRYASGAKRTCTCSEASPPGLPFSCVGSTGAAPGLGAVAWP